jgi:hypothetical protein
MTFSLFCCLFCASHLGGAQMSQRGIGIVGARALPDSFREQVSAVVRYLVERDYQIHTGGAMGADQFALEAVISSGAYDRAVLFSAWSCVAGFPRSVQRHVDYYISHRGRVDWGFVQPGASRGIAISGLLARNIRLVSASYGIVAFLYGDSHGTTRTVLQAISRRLKVVVFVCGGEARLPEVSSGHWVELSCASPWGGGFLYRR